MPTTVKDIARAAGVSVSTVSYALNGGPRTVPVAVRERVMRVAIELDYRPNRLARSLVTRTTHAIGIVPTDLVENLSRVGYFSAVFNGVVNRAEETGQDVTLLTRRAAGGVDPDSVGDGRTDGLIFLAPLIDSPALRAARERKVPHVVVSGHAGEAPAVLGDNRRGVELALDHLFELGHRRILHVTGKLTHEDARERRDAFVRRGRELGLPLLVEEGDFTGDGGRLAFLRSLTRGDRATAVLAANDDTAHGVIMAARDEGLSVPDDISVVGFDDAFFAPYLQPPLTTVAQPLDEMGAAAVDALLKLVSGDSSESRLFATQLTVRASTSRPKLDPS